MNQLNIDQLEIKTLGRSQKGQDSILKHIFDTIGTTNKYYVEFGAADGIVSSNTWHFKNHENWNGLLMDIDHENIDINLHRHKITKENIIELFKQHNVPIQFDFLCIDIDGNDYWILSEILKHYSPRVIMIETNVRFDPTESIVMKYDPNFMWNGYDWYGASPLAIKKLCDVYNYSPAYLHIDDMILIQTDQLSVHDQNKDWSKIYPCSYVELYNDHIKPGHGPILEYNKNNWITV